MAITRAKQKLFITHTRQRLIYGSTQRNKLSRFVTEIPQRDLEFEDHTAALQSRIDTAEPARNRPARRGSLQQEARHNQAEKLAANISAAHQQSFSAGERVRHKVFGEGTILTAQAVANDHLLEISFDKAGTKKIMANFAKIEKI